MQLPPLAIHHPIDARTIRIVPLVRYIRLVQPAPPDILGPREPDPEPGPAANRHARRRAAALDRRRKRRARAIA